MKTVFAALLLMLPLLANAAELKHDPKAASDLAEVMQTMNTVTADFVQLSPQANGGKQKMERGNVFIKRPNRFRWDVTSPFNQQIISNGDKIWMIDPDFQQVVVKVQEQNGGAVALQLLSGNTAGFLKDYAVRRGVYGPETVYTLTPRKKADLFESMDINFTRGKLSAIKLVDAFGGTRRIDFSRMRLNVPINNSTFAVDRKSLERQGFDILDETAQ